MKLPDMHQSNSEAQWHSVPQADWNKYQIFADKHGEWATPSNLISVIGAVSTTAGLLLMGSDSTTKGLAGVTAIGFGRCMDIMDGYVAARTHTKSPTGEKVDAGVDTALMVGALAILMNNGIFPEAQGILTASVTAAKMTFTGIAKHNKNEIHASRAGKLGSFGLWGAVGSYSVAKIANIMSYPGIDHSFHITGNIILGTGLVLSAIAANDYRNSAWPKKKNRA